MRESRTGEVPMLGAVLSFSLTCAVFFPSSSQPPRSPHLLGTATSSQSGATWHIAGSQAGARLGSSIATADVDGDGYGDLIVGAPGQDGTHLGEGLVSVYLGSASGLALAPQRTVRGQQPRAHLGQQVARAGDVNGDGFEDVLVSAPDFDGGPPLNPHFVGPLGGRQRYTGDQGLVALFLGSAAGLSAAPQRTLVGLEPGEHVGTALACAGDVNGDGFDDILFGASDTGGGRGAVFLFAGGPAGIVGPPSWMQIGPGAGFEGWGTVLGSAGDVNRDGYADFVVGMPSAAGCSRLALFLGSPLGPGPMQLVDEGLSVLGPAVDLDQDGELEQFLLATGCPDAALRWRRLGGAGSGAFPILGTPGALVSGDFDGDGRADLAAGVPDFGRGPFHGRVLVYTSQPGLALSPAAAFPVFDGDQPGAGFGAALAAIDVDGDGADELLVAAPHQDAGLPGQGTVSLFPGWRPTRTVVPVTTQLPRTSLEAVGDFDGDGRSDLVTARANDEDSRVEVRYGSPAGLSTVPAGTLVLAQSPNCCFVRFFVSAGDLNGDGYDEALVSFRPAQSTGSPQPSTTHSIHLGGPLGLSLDPALTLDGGSDSLSEADVVRDVNGDGFDDMILLRVVPPSSELYLGTAGLPVLQGTLPTADNHAPHLPALFSHARHRAVLSGNLNGDAFGDVLLARLTSQGRVRAELYFGSPAGLDYQGSWRPETDLYPLGFGNTADFVALADLTGDGLDDLLVERIEGSGAQEFALFAGSASGLTRSPQWWEPDSTVYSPLFSSSFFFNRVQAVLDVDADGYPDLLLDGRRIHRGSPAGIERVPAWYGLPTVAVEPLELFDTPDFDGDGFREILSGSTVEEIR